MANLYEGASAAVRRKCFISYHHADQDAAIQFVNTFDHNKDIFIRRLLGESPEDLINSTDTDYVMSQIRTRFLKDSSVTIVLMGKCTYARRYVDWEIQSSLRRGQSLPNGLLGIKLPTFTSCPPRFSQNLIEDSSPQKDCYARWIEYPTSVESLRSAIEAAYERRTTHAGLIVNPRERMKYNRTCE